jgi:hypothetical protein
MNSKSKRLPKLNLLIELFSIDSASPSGLSWKTYSKGRRKDLCAGSKTFNKSTGKTYWQVYINKSAYYVHRIIYYLHTKKDPGKLIVDHINGDSTFNLIENLRAITQHENSINHKLYKSNKTKLTGICYSKAMTMYQAYVFRNGEQFHVGYFKTIDEAFKARLTYLSSLNDEDDQRMLMPEELK